MTPEELADQQEKSNHMYDPETIKLMAISEPAWGAGKSNLIIRWIRGTFCEEYDPTIEDSYLHRIEVRGESYAIDVFDSAGAEGNASPSFADNCLRPDGFLCVYSIADKRSFTELPALMCRIRQARYPKPTPMILIGNKLDLENQRQVLESEGLNVAKSLGCSWMEVSAKESDREDITAIFASLAGKVLDVRESSPWFTEWRNSKARKRCVLA